MLSCAAANPDSALLAEATEVLAKAVGRAGPDDPELGWNVDAQVSEPARRSPTSGS
jgi:hypothetical protein